MLGIQPKRWWYVVIVNVKFAFLLTGLFLEIVVVVLRAASQSDRVCMTREIYYTVVKI